MVVLLFSTTIIFSCKAPKPKNQPVLKEMDFSNPPTVIYKTKNDYSQMVPVTLSEDKTKIVSYPGPQDLYFRGILATPTQLDRGYWLDNRGLNMNSVFLNISYGEYSKWQKMPSLVELYSHIIDKDPFTAFYNCGNRYQYWEDEVLQLNTLINNKGLSRCKCLVDIK
jgi:hypothetical protein